MSEPFAATPLPPASIGRTEHRLKADDADALMDGSLLFAGAETGPDAEWWIFARSRSQREDIPAVFALRGTVPARGTADAFVCAAYRIVLAREADEVGRGAFTALLEAGETARSTVLRRIVTSAEARSRGDQYVLVPKPSRWLGEDAVAPADAGDHRVVVKSPPAVVPSKLHSPLQLYPGYADDDLVIFEEFRDPNARAEIGFVVDFLGGRTRTASLWRVLRHLDGQLQGIPVPADHHSEAIEWIGLLKSVKSAGTRYVAMELGAGYGPWSVAGGQAARRRGITDIRLYAVEADPQHFQLLRQNFADNGFDPDHHTLLEAAVGAVAGSVRWPAFADSTDDWGSRPIEGPAIQGESARDYLGRSFTETIVVNIVPMLDVVRREPKWDLVHIDVQGTEVGLVQAALDELNLRAHWLVIGTHSRKIDGDLVELLSRAGWLLEHEKPAKFVFRADAATLEAMTTLDGTQVWSNPRWSAD